MLRRRNNKSKSSNHMCCRLDSFFSWSDLSCAWFRLVSGSVQNCKATRPFQDTFGIDFDPIWIPKNNQKIKNKNHQKIDPEWRSRSDFVFESVFHPKCRIPQSPELAKPLTNFACYMLSRKVIPTWLDAASNIHLDLRKNITKNSIAFDVRFGINVFLFWLDV